MSGAEFMSWLRKGLGTVARPIDGADGGVAKLTVALAGGQTVGADLSTIAPGDVAGLAGTALAHRSPPAGSSDGLPGALAWARLADPLLPWALPTGDDTPGSPMPWLALVCVPDGPGRLVASARPLPQLNLYGAARALLPEPALIPLLAHAERPLAGGPPIARLIAPTRLVAGTAYLAALVPCREAGRLAGLGWPVDGATGFAWGPDRAPDALPVYAHWRFRCGAVPRFEDVIARLHPVPEAGRPHAARLSARSLELLGQPRDAEVTVPLRAPFGAPGGVAEPPRAIVDALVDALETAPAHAGELGLPVYGRRQALDGASWPQAIATTPSLRLGAGLGARLVRRHRDALADFAVAHVGEVDRANAMLARARAALAARQDIWRRLKGHAGSRQAEALALLGPAARRIDLPSGLGGATPAAAAEGWTADLFDPALRRALRGPAARAAGGDGAATRPSGQAAPDLTRLLNDAQKDASEALVPRGKLYLERGADFAPGDDRAPIFESTDDPLDMIGLLIDPPSDGSIPEDDAPQIDWAEGRERRREGEEQRAAGEGRPGRWLDPAPLVEAMVAAIEPRRAIGRRVGARIDAPGREPDDLGPIHWEPPWPEPLVELLARENPALVAPAAETLPRDGAVLLGLDAPFIEAMLAGANHAAVTDLIWRRFPVRQDMSPVRRVFPRMRIAGAAAPPFDAPPLRAWNGAAGANLGAGRDAADRPRTIVLMRTPVFELYPETVLYAARAVWTESGVELSTLTADRIFPVAFSRLGRELVYAGFALKPAEMAGGPFDRTAAAGHFLVFQGPEEEGGFALAAEGGTGPSWSQIGSSSGPPAVLSLDQPAGGGRNPLAGLTAAKAAAELLERPLTVAIHASRLMEMP